MEAIELTVQRLCRVRATVPTWRRPVLSFFAGRCQILASILAVERELQRDWGRAATYELTTSIARQFGGAYGLGIIYAKSMFGGHEG